MLCKMHPEGAASPAGEGVLGDQRSEGLKADLSGRCMGC